MLYRRFGTTGVEVSSQCLGAMTFGKMGDTDPDDCVRIVERALDAGINFIDTADVYSGGQSEEIVGRAVRTRRERVVLATKCYYPMGADRNDQGSSRRWIIRAVEASLRRLGTDYIDLYQMHKPDWDTDPEETLSALSDLVRQGKVLYLGSSSFPADWIVESQWAAARRNSERFVYEQPQYSIFARSIETSILPACQRHRMSVIAWSPLAGGWLTGKYRRDEQRHRPGGPAGYGYARNRPLPPIPLAATGGPPTHRSPDRTHPADLTRTLEPGRPSTPPGRPVVSTTCSSLRILAPEYQHAEQRG